MASPSLEDLRDLAVHAAAAGASVVAAAAATAAATGRATAAELKGHGDYVTAVDRAAEAAVVEVLRAGAPEIPVLAEEGGHSGAGGDGRCWAVDPLDGTTNFTRRYPVVGVSVGLMEDGLPVAGAVAAPLLGVSWAAGRGLGAHDSAGNRLAVRESRGGGVAATGFPFRIPERRPRYLAVFEQALALSEDLRRAGAASLDMTYAAQGTFDGYFELGLSIWDLAAGGIILCEAGGVVTDWEGDPRGPYRSGDVLAGAPAWHERMLTITRSPVAAPAAPSGAQP